MFWWFKRGDQFLGYESREVSKDTYELTIRMPDGSERIEQFGDSTALHDRQVRLEQEWAGEGWTGPHGWNL
jgi:hypothetical protein